MVGPLSQWQVLVLTTQHVDLTLRLMIKVPISFWNQPAVLLSCDPQFGEDRVKQEVCDLGQHGLRQEVPLNTCPHQPEWLTALNPFLGRDRASTRRAFIFRHTHARTLRHTRGQLYAFAQDVKGFLDKCSASGSVLINLPETHTHTQHTYNTQRDRDQMGSRDTVITHTHMAPAPERKNTNWQTSSTLRWLSVARKRATSVTDGGWQQAS